MLITRTAKPEDAAAISALIGQLSAELTIHPDGRGAELFFQSVTPEAERQYLSDPRYTFTIMLDGEQVVACIAMRDRTHYSIYLLRQRINIRAWHPNFGRPCCDKICPTLESLVLR